MTIYVTTEAECDRCHRRAPMQAADVLPDGWFAGIVMPTGDDTVTTRQDLCRRCRAQLDRFRQNLPAQAGDPGQPDNPGPPQAAPLASGRDPMDPDPPDDIDADIRDRMAFPTGGDTA